MTMLRVNQLLLFLAAREVSVTDRKGAGEKQLTGTGFLGLPWEKLGGYRLLEWSLGPTRCYSLGGIPDMLPGIGAQLGTGTPHTTHPGLTISQVARSLYSPTGPKPAIG